ncbi:hypothetical protein [Caballeronia sp. dw_19]|uniref:hypothetical protein n=1 Tax=Caballeronia sp. dw_19 TaxID=2719791 RepID=UPI001BCDAB76|nr:hypothetical protein [Caballeronia sp. dw_19]
MKLAALEQIVGHLATRGGWPRARCDAAAARSGRHAAMDRYGTRRELSGRAQLAVANSQRETLKAKAGHYPTLDLVASYAKSSLGAAACKTNAVHRLSMPQ